MKRAEREDAGGGAKADRIANGSETDSVACRPADTRNHPGKRIDTSSRLPRIGEGARRGIGEGIAGIDEEVAFDAIDAGRAASAFDRVPPSDRRTEDGRAR
jgi:hypothetical protein